ncbi:opine metallophore biosynthesis dehydrogenase [Paenibacillus sp. QZ-Y1]|uniref:opine metallophore biosynthesis dehydrogenase n=1 Tax=Paenibacillus sp. QZ-Y1 TaxID=3414511 RepID=UPI003F79FD1D
MKKLKGTAPLGNVLIVGAGPAGIHVAVDLSQGWSRRIGLANRKGIHTNRLKNELEHQSFWLRTEVLVERSKHLSAAARLDHFYAGFETIEDDWQTIILCVPSHSYVEVIRELKLANRLQVEQIILISPGIGSNILVQESLGLARDRVEVISFSTYYAATKFDPGVSNLLKSIVKGMKRKIYIGSSQANSNMLFELQGFMASLGIEAELTSHPIEAESKSITTYVHPPFFLNSFSLNEIFSLTHSTKYMYKLYPEGPITPDAIRSMVRLWKEISSVVVKLGTKPVNLLKFMNDDNYPVQEQTLSRAEIEGFVQLEEIHQEYLLYIRYASLLIDPFSTPSEQGQYRPFAAVPYQQVSLNQERKWVIPRVPYEDYRKLKLMYSVGQALHIQMPQTKTFILTFENQIEEFMEEQETVDFRLDVVNDNALDEAGIIIKVIQTQNLMSREDVFEL